MTLSQFRNRVRVAIAFDRLADGYENFALLSADLGFVDQSHLSWVVRTYTGERLSELRQRLGPLDRLEPGGDQEPAS
jgi:AraC-like DNA-binding protein